jgi:hypothetical protein
VIGCGTRRAKESTMPMRLSISQRNAFVSAMVKFTKGSSGWFPAYNPNFASERMRLTSEVGKWLEADAGVPAKCNCWEAILIAGFNAGLWGTDYVKAAVGVTAVDIGLSLRRLVCFMSCCVRTKFKGFAGQIVMIGDEGQHFALSCGYGKVIELDNGRAGLIALDKVLEISPYNNKKNEVYISDPPTLDELNQY